MILAVIFSQKDIEILSDILNENSIVLGDIVCDLHVREHVRPTLEYSLEKKLCAQVKEIFICYESKTGAESLVGFANNFYECSVAPVIAYVSTLANLLKKLKAQGESVEVWFPSKLLLAPKYSAYFMAEHESQGQRLYSRESVFLPYLEQVCKQQGALVKYKRRQLGVASYWQKIARVSSVFLWRLNQEVLSKLKKPLISAKNPEPIELIAVTRSVGQTEFLAPFFAESGRKVALLAAETALGKGRNSRLVNALSAEIPTVFAGVVHSTVRDVLKSYVRTFSLIARKPSINLESSGVALNLDQAFTEVLVMWPELINYREALTVAIGNLAIPISRILLSTEQKSPHAHADAWVAKKFNLVCMHAMQCDQHARPLPFPVFGDYFLTDNMRNAKAFCREWGGDAPKVKYVGSIKACLDDTYVRAQYENVKKSWCFFSQVDNIDANKSILRILRELSKNVSQEYYVKLHPRDCISNYPEFQDVNFIADGVFRKHELFRKFDYAISYPSGIVTDLIFARKPFLLLLIDEWSFGAYSYKDDSYGGNVYNLDEIEKVMSRPELLAVHFESYRNRIFKESGIFSDTNTMVEDMMKLSLKKIASREKNRTD